MDGVDALVGKSDIAYLWISHDLNAFLKWVSNIGLLVFSPCKDVDIEHLNEQNDYIG